jgi:hypothetical protein
MWLVQRDHPALFGINEEYALIIMTFCHGKYP